MVIPRRLALLAVLHAAPLAAQSAADRATLDSVLVRLGRAGDAVPTVDQGCPNLVGSLARACEGFLAARRAEFQRSPGDAARARDLFERVVADEPEWPMAWYGLGIARLQAARAGMVMREGPLHPIGVSNEAGGGYALIRAVELDTTFGLAIDALARAPWGREGASRGKERLPLLRRLQSRLGGPALHAAALLELEGGSADTAVAWLEALRRAGSFPHGLTDHLLARAYHRVGRQRASEDAFMRGADDTLGISQATYRAEVAWVATPEELAEWDSLPPADRGAWMRRFWAGRDVAGGHPEGRRLQEHFDRMIHVMANYRLSLPQSGRNRAAGTAATIDPYPETMVAELFKEFPFFNEPSTNTPLSDVASSVTRAAMDARTIAGDLPFRLLKASEDVLDDRGLMYLRHGPPDKSARTTGGEAMELWLYDLPTGPQFLSFKEIDFDGQAGASRLVPTLMGTSMLARNQVCHLKPSLCSFDADPSGANATVGIRGVDCPPERPCPGIEGQLLVATGVRIEGLARVADEAARLSSGVDLARERSEGMEAIKTLGSTDGYRPTFALPVTPRVQLVGLRDHQADQGFAVAAIALAGADLWGHQLDAESTQRAYQLRVQLQAVRRTDGARFDFDQMRTFMAPKEIAKGEYLTTVLAKPLPPGEYTASLIVTQPDGRGAVASLPRLRVPSGTGKFAISDLVLGRERSGTRWSHGQGEVRMNPLNAVARAEQMSLYYQVEGLTDGESYAHRLELSRADDPAGEAPRLAVGFVLVATGERAEVTRDLGVGRLEPGSYRVRVTVTHGDRMIEAVSWVRIVK